MVTGARVTVGFPKMHREPSERRDFLPPLIGLLAANGAEVHVESGIGSEMGYTDLATARCHRRPVSDETRIARTSSSCFAPDGKYDSLARRDPRLVLTSRPV
jgi:hypothetical protein